MLYMRLNADDTELIIQGVHLHIVNVLNMFKHILNSFKVLIYI